jgi:hypothetical protein
MMQTEWKITLLLAFLLSMKVTAQEINPWADTAKLNRVQQVIIEPMVGWPAVGIYLLNKANLDEGNELIQYDQKGIPVQLGARFEYMLKHRFGMAFETNYERTGYERSFYAKDPVSGLLDTSNVIQTNWVEGRARFVLRIQYHFVQKEKLDMYAGIGGGYVLINSRGASNGSPDPIVEPTGIKELYLERLSEPIAARVFLGSRIHFTQRFGLSAEVGIGSGSAVQLGFFSRME